MALFWLPDLRYERLSIRGSTICGPAGPAGGSNLDLALVVSLRGAAVRDLQKLHGVAERHSCPVAGRKANYDTHRQRPEPREVSLSLGIVCTSASTGGRPVQSTPLTHGRFRGRAACRSAEGRATGARDQLAAMCAATALQAGLERTPWFARIWTRAIRIAR